MKLAAILLFVLFVCGCEEPGVRMTVQPVRGLNLRDRPGVDGRVTRIVPHGASVFVFREQGAAESGWVRVRYLKLNGWMYALYLKEGPAPQGGDFGTFFRSVLPFSESGFEGVNPSRVILPLDFESAGRRGKIGLEEYLKRCRMGVHDTDSSFPRIGLYVLGDGPEETIKSDRRLLITVSGDRVARFFFSRRGGYWFLIRLSFRPLSDKNDLIAGFARFLRRLGRDRKMKNMFIPDRVRVRGLSAGSNPRPVVRMVPRDQVLKWFPDFKKIQFIFHGHTGRFANKDVRILSWRFNENGVNYGLRFHRGKGGWILTEMKRQST